MVHLVSSAPGLASDDVMALCVRLARRLREQGAPYPVAAALALAVRGRRAQHPVDFARAVGIDSVLLARIEAGEVAIGDWPDALVGAARGTPGFPCEVLDEPSGDPRRAIADGPIGPPG